MKTLKTSIYDNLEFVFTTSTYSTTGNTYVGIHCKENDCIEPYCNLTVNLDGALYLRAVFHRRVCKKYSPRTRPQRRYL